MGFTPTDDAAQNSIMTDEWARERRWLDDGTRPKAGVLPP